MENKNSNGVGARLEWQNAQKNPVKNKTSDDEKDFSVTNVFLDSWSMVALKSGVSNFSYLANSIFCLANISFCGNIKLS